MIRNATVAGVVMTAYYNEHGAGAVSTIRVTQTDQTGL